MDINIISDIHARRNRSGEVIYDTGFDPSKLKKCDVLIIAGDAANNGDDTKSIIDDINKYKGVVFQKLIVVKGNHDYYTNTARLKSARCNPTIGPFGFTEIYNDIAFICTTLWSPIYDNPSTIHFCLNDYVKIPYYCIEENNEVFENCVKFLKHSIEKNKDRKCIIVTHHLPSKQLICDEFKNDILNEAFCVMHKSKSCGTYIDDVINSSTNIPLWVHGHSHQFMDKTINNIRFIRNPIGYYFKGRNECDFKYDCIVTI